MDDELDPNDDDTDDDGLIDGLEDLNANGVFDEATDLSSGTRFDTDGDGLSDGLEVGLEIPQGSDTNLTLFQGDLDPGNLNTDPQDADTDDDGLADGSEDANANGAMDSATETDPAVFDTDGDGLGDGLERGEVLSLIHI